MSAFNLPSTSFYSRLFPCEIKKIIKKMTYVTHKLPNPKIQIFALYYYTLYRIDNIEIDSIEYSQKQVINFSYKWILNLFFTSNRVVGCKRPVNSNQDRITQFS